MDRKIRTKRNLVISVLIAIVGMATLYASNELIGFRFDGGYRTTMTSELWIGVKAMLIMILEWGSSIIGILAIALGIIGIYNNTKKLMR